jgi:hypothetical protein
LFPLLIVKGIWGCDRLKSFPDLIRVSVIRERLRFAKFLSVGRLVAMHRALGFMLHLVVQIRTMLGIAAFSHDDLLCA